MAETTKHQRRRCARADQARYIIETEEWKVQPVADDASDATVFANGLSAVKTGDLATAEKMQALLATKAVPLRAAPPLAARMRITARRPRPGTRRRGESRRRQGRAHHAQGAAALIAEAKGQKDQADRRS